MFNLSADAYFGAEFIWYCKMLSGNGLRPEKLRGVSHLTQFRAGCVCRSLHRSACQFTSCSVIQVCADVQYEKTPALQVEAGV